MNYRYNILWALTHKKQGFTFVEVMVTAVIVIVLGAIAVPLYKQYIEKAQKAAAMAVMDQLPVLVEAYRADNGRMCPDCTANGTHTYTYSENAAGGVVDTGVNKDITDNYPNFKAKSSSQTAASLYHYQIVFTVAGCPACTTSAVTTALPQTGRGAPAGNIVSNPF